MSTTNLENLTLPIHIDSSEFTTGILAALNEILDAINSGDLERAKSLIEDQKDLVKSGPAYKLDID